jgi:hypothetical protein
VKFKVFILAISFLLLGCKTSTEPIFSLRNLKWSVDTLSDQNLRFNSIWGTSTSNLYIVGDKGIWHYNGSNWKDLNLPFRSLEDIYGFSTEKIYVVGGHLGEYSTIITYNGYEWSQLRDNSNGELWAISGNSPSDLLAGGYNNLIKYDGNSWSVIDVPVAADDSIDFFVTDINHGLDGTYYILLWTSTDDSRGDDDIEYFLKYLDGAWQILDGYLYNPSRLWISPSGTIYGTGGGFSVWENGQWNNLFIPSYKFGDSGSIIRAFGVADDNFFTINYHGYLYYFDSFDWYKYTNLPFENGTVNYIDGWTDGKEVYIIGEDFPHNYVIYGSID